MSGEFLERFQLVSKLAETTDQNALRQVTAFALATASASDPEAREAGQAALLKAARAFTGLLSMTFQAVAWNKEVLYDEVSFRGIYEKVLTVTKQFAQVDEATVRELLASFPPSLLVLRSIAALSLDEISMLLKETQDVTVSKDQLRDFELGREVGKVDRERWLEALLPLSRILFQAVSGQLLEVPPTVDKSLFRDRKDKIDTRAGWESVRQIADEGVPYWGLLYQRYVGGFFRQAMDASSSIKGDILEVAIVRLLTEKRIPFYRTRAREKISSWEQAPDFLLPNRDSPTVAIEAKLAEDGGTARDKAARIERFCNEARGKSVFPIAVVDGKGFYRINDVTAPILRNTRGEAYTLKTLSRLLALPQVNVLMPEP